MKLIQLLKEIKINNPSRGVVYAICDYAGVFMELSLINKSQIVEDGEETEDGTYIAKIKEDDRIDEFYYLEKLEL